MCFFLCERVIGFLSSVNSVANENTDNKFTLIAHKSSLFDLVDSFAYYRYYESQPLHSKFVSL